MLFLLSLLISLVTANPVHHGKPCHHRGDGVCIGLSFRPTHGPAKDRSINNMPILTRPQQTATLQARNKVKERDIIPTPAPDSPLEESGVPGFPLHTVHLTPDLGPSHIKWPEIHFRQVSDAPAVTKSVDSGVPGFPLHTVHLTPDPGPSHIRWPNLGLLQTINVKEVSDQPAVTTSVDVGVPGFPLHTVHLTPASDPVSSTIHLMLGSSDALPTSLSASKATQVLHTEGGFGGANKLPGFPTSTACTTTITRLPSAVSGPTKIVYASTTTFTVLYPCGDCSMEVVDSPAETWTTNFTTTITVEGVSTFATGICTDYPLPHTSSMGNPPPMSTISSATATATATSHQQVDAPASLRVRSPEKDAAEDSTPEEPQCTTTLYVNKPFETAVVQTVWKATKTITDVVNCHGCQLTVINSNGVGPEVFYTSMETVRGTSTTTTRVCGPTPTCDDCLVEHKAFWYLPG